MKFFIALIILVLGLGAGFYVGSGADFFNTDFIKINVLNKFPNLNITSSVKEVLPASEYVSLVYHYSDVITHSDAIKLFSLGNIPFTERKAIYTIDGAVKLGFNGKDIKVERSGDAIILHMPKIRIMSHEIYPETFNLYDERTGLFNRYGIKDANEIQRAHKAEREKKVNENLSLFDQAMLAAEQAFTSLLENIPGVKTKHSLNFQWAEEII